MYCSKCGNLVTEGQNFCPQCGHPLSPDVPQPNAEAQDAWSKRGKNAVSSAVNAAVEGVAGHIDNFYGAVEHVDLKFSDFFSEVATKHTHEEAEEIFIAGTAKTTPPLEVAVRSWQKPWFYSRVLLFMLIPYFICTVIWSVFANPNVLPGIMVLGSFAVPFATASFFFEANVEQNISFMDVLRDFLVGGTLSLLIALPLFKVIPGSGVNAMMPALITGFIEEVAKALAVAVLMMQRKRPASILNGLLLGATVGAGFAAFESAGYAFTFLIQGGTDDMFEVIAARGFLAVGGHVAWAALEGAGLAIACKGLPKPEWSALLHPKFLVLFIVSVVCHGYWDWAPLTASIPVPYAEYAILILIIWIFLLIFLRRGIAEVNDMVKAAQPSELGPENPAEQA